jgi:hypothetical protein
MLEPGWKQLIRLMHFGNLKLGLVFIVLTGVGSVFCCHACRALACTHLEPGRCSMEGNAYTGKYADELVATAKRLASAGKGILAADESTGTVGKRVRLYCVVDPKHIAPALRAPFQLGTIIRPRCSLVANRCGTSHSLHAAGRHQCGERGAEQENAAGDAVPCRRH